LIRINASAINRDKTGGSVASAATSMLLLSDRRDDIITTLYVLRHKLAHSANCASYAQFASKASKRQGVKASRRQGVKASADSRRPPKFRSRLRYDGPASEVRHRARHLPQPPHGLGGNGGKLATARVRGGCGRHERGPRARVQPPQPRIQRPSAAVNASREVGVLLCGWNWPHRDEPQREGEHRLARVVSAQRPCASISRRAGCPGLAMPWPASPSRPPAASIESPSSPQAGRGDAVRLLPGVPPSLLSSCFTAEPDHFDAERPSP